MPTVEGGRWDQLARKLFEISGNTAVPDLAEAIQPVFIIQPDSAEHAFLRKERLYGGRASAGAVAAQTSHVGLSNPADSQTIIIVDCFNARPGANDIMFVAVSQEALTTSLGWTNQAYSPRDLRLPQSGSANAGTAKLVTLTTAVAQGDTVFQFGALQNGNSIDHHVAFVLVPNTGLIIRSQATNQSTQAAFSWKERPVTPIELPRT